MRRVCSVSLILALAASSAMAADATDKIIDFPCSRNLADGRVLVDGPQWDEKMHELGYVLAEGAYVPFEVVAFTQKAQQDQTWADGMCRMRLLPVAK